MSEQTHEYYKHNYELMKEGILTFCKDNCDSDCDNCVQSDLCGDWTSLKDECEQNQAEGAAEDRARDIDYERSRM